MPHSQGPRKSARAPAPLPARVHLVGIGGRAMGAVAAELARRGCSVTGSDPHPFPEVAAALRSAGVRAHARFRARNIPRGTDLAVVGPVYGRGNPEVETILRRRIPFLSLPELVSRHLLARSARVALVAGTNGKSTTATLLALLLRRAGRRADHLLGATARDLPELGPPARFSGAPVAVIEGDEYLSRFGDRNPKFLHYRPRLVAVTNLRPDHPEMYGSPEEYRGAFGALVDLIPPDGLLLLNADDPECLALRERARCRTLAVGFSRGADLRVTGLRATSRRTRFRFLGVGFEIALAGRMNALNAALALAAARALGVAPARCPDSLAAFRGVVGRQDLLLDTPRVAHIDDIAYHPDALAGLLDAVRQRYPRRRVTMILQPRYTGGALGYQQRVLPDRLAGADAVFLLPHFDFPDASWSATPFRPARLRAALARAGVEVHPVRGFKHLGARLRRFLRPGDVIVSSIVIDRRDVVGAIRDVVARFDRARPSRARR